MPSKYTTYNVSYLLTGPAPTYTPIAYSTGSIWTPSDNINPNTLYNILANTIATATTTIYDPGDFPVTSCTFGNTPITYNTNPNPNSVYQLGYCASFTSQGPNSSPPKLTLVPDAQILFQPSSSPTLTVGPAPAQPSFYSNIYNDGNFILKTFNPTYSLVYTGNPYYIKVYPENSVNSYVITFTPPASPLLLNQSGNVIDASTGSASITSIDIVPGFPNQQFSFTITQAPILSDIDYTYNSVTKISSSSGAATFEYIEGVLDVTTNNISVGALSPTVTQPILDVDCFISSNPISGPFNVGTYHADYTIPPINTNFIWGPFASFIITAALVTVIEWKLNTIVGGSIISTVVFDIDTSFTFNNTKSYTISTTDVDPQDAASHTPTESGLFTTAGSFTFNLAASTNYTASGSSPTLTIVNQGNIPTLQQVTNSGYITNINIEPYNITDSITSNGTSGQFLSSTGTTIIWTDKPSNSLSEAPPQIIFNNSTVNNSNIYIDWFFPTQTAAGFIAGGVPVINSFSANLYNTTSGVTYTYSQLTNNSTTQYINNGINLGTAIQGLVLTQNITLSSNLVQTTTFPSSKNILAQVLYISDLSTISDGNCNLNAWYSNYNPGYISNTHSLPTYSVVVPDSPTYFVKSGYSGVNISPTISYTWIAPNPNGGTISAYKIKYSTPGSSISLITQSVNGITGSVSSGTALSVFPDCEYTTNVMASNSLNPSNFGPVSNSNLWTSNCIPQNTQIILSPTTMTFNNGTYYTGSLATDTSGTNNISNITSVSIGTSSTISYNITLEKTRGHFGDGNQLTTLSSNIVSKNYTNYISPVSSKIKTGSSITANNTSITYTSSDVNIQLVGSATPIDFYTTPSCNLGFYYKSSASLLNLYIIPGPNVYTLNLTQAYNIANPPSPSVSSFTYANEETYSTPTITSSVLLLNDGNFRQVSGIWVLYSTAHFTVTNSVQDIGVYFYKNPILSYNFSTLGNFSTSGTTEINPPFTTNKFTSSVNFSKLISTTTPTQFAKTVSTTITALNIIGSSVGTVTSNIIIVDSVSPMTRYTIVNSFTDYSVQALYNDSGADITSTNDLQCVAGKICTPSVDSYLNYTIYWYYSSSLNKNSLNYSGITTGVRYVMVRTIVPQSFNTSLTIAINGTLNGSPITTITSINSLFYRIIVNSTPTPTDGTNFSSTWIDAISTSGTQVNSTNYFNPNLISLTFWSQTATGLQNTVTFPGAAFTASSSTYLYIQLGLDVSVQNIKISSIIGTFS